VLYRGKPFGVDTNKLNIIAQHAHSVAQTYDFVCAYLNPHAGGQYLSYGVAQKLTNAGLQVISVYEHKHMDEVSYYTGSGVNSAEAHGIKDGEQAYDDALAAGQGNWSGSAIYFGAEPPTDLHTVKLLNDIADYFRGIEEGFRDEAQVRNAGTVLFTIGVYGYGETDRFIKGYEATYSWLAGSPAAAEGYTKWNIKQNLDAAHVGGILVDTDHAAGQHFGEWGLLYA
jgi:hypothetical protein